MLSWSWRSMKLLLLHLVGVPYYFIRWISVVLNLTDAWKLRNGTIRISVSVFSYCIAESTACCPSANCLVNSLNVSHSSVRAITTDNITTRCSTSISKWHPLTKQHVGVARSAHKVSGDVMPTSISSQIPVTQQYNWPVRQCVRGHS
jgi:hypothetical protein